VGRGKGVFVLEKVRIPLLKSIFFNVSNTKRTVLTYRKWFETFFFKKSTT